MKTKYQILIIGGGTAGIMVAAQLKKEDPSLEIGLLDPAETHYYQPAWTLVGANTYDFDKTARPMSSLIPKGVDWIREAVAEFMPEQNSIKTEGGKTLSYEFLVVCPGLRMAPELVEGLGEAMEKGVVCSNYTDPDHTWQTLKNFKGGTALFVMPTTPIKCGGAPQKIMYLADDHFRKTGVRDKTDILFAIPGGVIFAVKPIAATLMTVVDRKDINVRFFHNLVKVDPQEKIAWFEIAKDLSAGGCVVIVRRRNGKESMRKGKTEA